jgi:hypothetical protein
MLGCLRRIEGKEKVIKLERTEKKSFFLGGTQNVLKQVIGENLYTSFEQYKSRIKSIKELLYQKEKKRKMTIFNI